MKTFKTIALSTLTAAATLLTVALSTPAQACVGCSIKLNGVQFNGIQFNGVQFNDFKLNGFQLNGFQLNGVQFNGDSQPVSGQVLAVTLPEGMLAK